MNAHASKQQRDAQPSCCPVQTSIAGRQWNVLPQGKIEICGIVYGQFMMDSQIGNAGGGQPGAFAIP